MYFLPVVHFMTREMVSFIISSRCSLYDTGDGAFQTIFPPIKHHSVNSFVPPQLEVWYHRVKFLPYPSGETVSFFHKWRDDTMWQLFTTRRHFFLFHIVERRHQRVYLFVYFMTIPRGNPPSQREGRLHRNIPP